MKSQRTSRISWLLLVSLLLTLIACEARSDTAAPTADAIAAAPVATVAPLPTATAVPPTATPEPDPNAALKEALQAIVDKWAADERFPSAMLLVDIPQLDLYFKGAAGVRDRVSGTPIAADDAFAIASVTKTFIATVILRLYEQGLLDLDEPAANYLPQEIVDSMNVYKGVNFGPTITIRQLLTHTSGIVDYGFIDVNGNGIGDGTEEQLAHPDKVWTPTEVVLWTVNHAPPYHAPGGPWVYSSTNYQLLGMIIEEVTGDTLADALTDYLFAPLGMQQTWLEGSGEPLTDAPLNISHPYTNNVDVLPLNSFSWAWAGGGIVSTLDDQDRFWRALLADNSVFENPATLAEMETMLEAIAGNRAGYGLGLISYNLDALGMTGLPAIICHAGIYNNLSVYWPEGDATIVMTLNSDTDFRSYFPFMAELLMTIKALAPAEYAALVAPSDVAYLPIEPAPDPNADLTAALQAIVDKYAADERFPSAMLLVDAPDRGLYFKGAAGVRDFASGTPIEADDAFAIASVTKTFTAATILRLWEEGLLDLDDPVADYLPADIVNSINRFEGVNYGPEITIRQLLNHTAGVGDYGFLDADADGVSDFMAELTANPDVSMKPTDVVAWAIEHAPPTSAPGGPWVYSSTGYQLLGMIAEAASGRMLTDLYTDYFFAPLGMEHTWVDTYSEPLATDPFPISHAYGHNVDITTIEARSWGWGAGGIVSTLDDQDRFWRALLADNTVFTQPDTLATMETWVPALPGSRADYGLGLITYHLNNLGMEGLPSIVCHAGIYNNLSVYWPEQDVVIVLTLNSDTDFRTYFPFVGEVVRTLMAFDRDA